MTPTNMKNVLTGFKELLKDYSNGSKGTNLKMVRTFKKGIINEKAVLPAIILFPITEIHRGIRSGGVYRVDRNIDFHIVSKMANLRDSNKFIEELSQTVLNIFYDTNYPNNYQLPVEDEETIFHFEPGSIEYQNFAERDELFQRAIIPMTFSSWEQVPTTTLSKTIDSTNLSSISSYLRDMLDDSQALRNVKVFNNFSFPPVNVGNGAVITIIENVDERNRRETGRDNPAGYIDIFVWTKATPYEPILDFNIDTLENVKDVLQADPNLGGRCYMSNIEKIDFGVNSELMLYLSKVRFNTYTYRNLPKY